MRVGDVRNQRTETPVVCSFVHDDGNIVIAVLLGIAAGARAEEGDTGNLARKSLLNLTLERRQMRLGFRRKHVQIRRQRVHQRP